MLLTDSCNGVIFIDCMCNSGVYTDVAGQLVKGTAVRISEALREVARTYTDKNIYIYLNDIDKERVAELESHLPQDERVTLRLSPHVVMRTNCSELSDHSYMELGTCIISCFTIHMMRTLDWEALLPFFRNWGEVMINHMVSDPVRAISSAKKTQQRKSMRILI